MKRPGELLALVMFVLSACDGAGEPASSLEDARERAPLLSAPQPASSTLSGLGNLGLCRELHEVVGLGVGGAGVSVELPGIVSCSEQARLDSVKFYGPVSAGIGYGGLSATPAAVTVNGQPTGVMDAIIGEPEAENLFRMMSRSFSGALPPNQVTSRTGRVTCMRDPRGSTLCTLGGFVGFEAGGLVPGLIP